MWSFMATRKSLEGLKYDEGQLAVHPTSKPWGCGVSLHPGKLGELPQKASVGEGWE